MTRPNVFIVTTGLDNDKVLFVGLSGINAGGSTFKVPGVDVRLSTFRALERRGLVAFFRKRVTGSCGEDKIVSRDYTITDAGRSLLAANPTKDAP